MEFYLILDNTIKTVEEHRLRMFGPKRDEVTGEWRKLHNEKFRDL
jgi:hypothetical protein